MNNSHNLERQIFIINYLAQALIVHHLYSRMFGKATIHLLGY